MNVEGSLEGVEKGATGSADTCLFWPRRLYGACVCREGTCTTSQHAARAQRGGGWGLQAGLNPLSHKELFSGIHGNQAEPVKIHNYARMDSYHRDPELNLDSQSRDSPQGTNPKGPTWTSNPED
ncbi:hypothetical protein AOLI_G00121070 [Acnodon oligacanthus]